MRFPRVLGSLLMVALIYGSAMVGCTRSTPPSPNLVAPTPVTPTPSPGPSTSYYPSDTRTGDAKVDAVIDAVLTKNKDRLTESVQLTSTPCASPAEIGYPPCPSGTPNKTPVEVFARSTCAVNYLFDLPEAKQETQSRFTELPLHLYSVFRTKDAANQPGFGVVFVPDDMKSSRTLYVNIAGKIYGANLGCGETIMKGDDYLLPPKK